MTVAWSKYFRVCFWWKWNSNETWPHSTLDWRPHLHSMCQLCQALNKRKWYWRSAKATWLWLGAFFNYSKIGSPLPILTTCGRRNSQKFTFLCFMLVGWLPALWKLCQHMRYSFWEICQYFSVFSGRHFFTACYKHSSKSWKISLTVLLYWHWFSFRNRLVIKAAALYY